MNFAKSQEVEKWTSKKYERLRIGFGKKDGKPQGQDLEHWFTAEKAAGEEDFDSSTAGSTQGSETDPSQAGS
jgi:hypothetical protein